MSENRTALIILAAGTSSRMGSPKQLLDFRGHAMVCSAVRAGIAAACSPVVVVVGAFEAQIREALADLPVEFAVNERWPEGMGTSIQAGLQSLEALDIQGAILALADQPFIKPGNYRTLIEEHTRTTRPIVASRYSGTVGVPVFFAKDAFPLLMALRPAEGCKGVILAHREEALLVDCPEAALDIDTPEEYAAAVATSQLS